MKDPIASGDAAANARRTAARPSGWRAAAARAVAGLTLALAPVWVTAQAVAPAPAAVPAAPAVVSPSPPPGQAVEPRADDSNADRARSQPGNNAPMWRAVRNSGQTPGYSSLPGAEKGMLIQPLVQYPGTRATTAGEAWRQVRNRWIVPYGGALILIALLAVGIYYFAKGPMGGHEPPTGRVIERFTALERAAHWSVAVTFVILAVSGIVLAFGKHFLLPVLGSTLFGWLAYALKTAHNFSGPVFAVALVVLVLLYVRDNLPRAHDARWLARAGGMLDGTHVPSGKFNAGEKMLFWGGVVVLGLTVVFSGLVLDLLIPGWGQTRGEMQVAHMVHGVASMLMMAMFVGHIYMGTVGVRGAFDGMKTGYVDEAWAHEHHALWYEDVKAGRVPAVRSAGGTPPPVTAAPLRP